MGDALVVVLWDEAGVEYRVPGSVLEAHAGKLVWPDYARSRVVTAYFLKAAVELVEAARGAAKDPDATLDAACEEVLSLLPPGYVPVPTEKAAPAVEPEPVPAGLGGILKIGEGESEEGDGEQGYWDGWHGARLQMAYALREVVRGLDLPEDIQNALYGAIQREEDADPQAGVIRNRPPEAEGDPAEAARERLFTMMRHAFLDSLLSSGLKAE